MVLTHGINLLLEDDRLPADGDMMALTRGRVKDSYGPRIGVIVALRVWGLASVPISSSPCNMTHSVVSSRSRLLAKLSLPSIVRLPSAGGLTSRTTSLPAAMVTLSPARGTRRSGQLAGSDQFVGLTAGDRPSWA